MQSRRLRFNRATMCLSIVLLLLLQWTTACKQHRSPAIPPAQVRPTNAPVAQTPSPQPIKNTHHWSTNWISLFDGKTLTGWKITDFAGAGEVSVTNQQIDIGMGVELSGINWTNGPLPKIDYEISLEAMRVEGSDFFCGLTVPVRDSFCSLIVGGWGGSVVGISSLDFLDASENQTTKTLYFESKRWYPIRLRVTQDKLEAWIDNDKLVDVVTTGRKISLRGGDIERSVPLGISTYVTTAAIRNIKLRTIEK